MERQELINKGYCRISHKFGTIARIDRPDWREYMADKHSPWSRKEGMSWIKALGQMNAEDQYRRCYSKDQIDLGKGRAGNFPPSGSTITGYLE